MRFEKINRWLFKRTFNKEQRTFLNDILCSEYFRLRRNNRFTPAGLERLHEIEIIIKERPVKKIKSKADEIAEVKDEYMEFEGKYRMKDD